MAMYRFVRILMSYSAIFTTSHSMRFSTARSLVRRSASIPEIATTAGLTSIASTTLSFFATWSDFCPNDSLRRSMDHTNGQTIHAQHITNTSRLYDTTTDRPIQTYSNRAFPRPNVPIFICLCWHGPALADQSLSCTSLPWCAVEVHLRNIGKEIAAYRTEVPSYKSNVLTGYDIER